ncbi:MAG: hydrogenase nickel incorporation protein HypB [Lachnospiraceae bacterium]|nr:hydrogenase nickel incorporation protein HypB [Lachnospiraceae bacterium]
MKVIQVDRFISDANDKDAAKLREDLKAKGVLFLNLMSSPGSGKTTFLSRTLQDLKDLRLAVMEADIASTVDAERIAALGARSIQVHTGGMCHMDAGMTGAALETLGTDELDVIFLENVGNLICPAEFDTGAHKNVMILSVPEGDDKPLKYPLMFQQSDVLIVSKTDALPYFNFDLDKCRERALRLNPDIKIFPVSAKTGEGMEAWENWLRDAREKNTSSVTAAP